MISGAKKKGGDFVSPLARDVIKQRKVAMKINGKRKSVRGMNISEIGKMLVNISPRRDGTGLTVELTATEKKLFVGKYHSSLHEHTLTEAIKNTLRSSHKKLNLSWVKSQDTFTTYASKKVKS